MLDNLIVSDELVDGDVYYIVEAQQQLLEDRAAGPQLRAWLAHRASKGSLAKRKLAGCLETKFKEAAPKAPPTPPVSGAKQRKRALIDCSPAPPMKIKRDNLGHACMAP